MSENAKEKLELHVAEAGTAENAGNTVAETEAEARFKRRVVALTVGAVVLLCILLLLMCYQMIKIGVQNRRKAELTDAIAELEVQLENGDETIGIMRKKWWIVSRARQLGYQFEQDK